MRLPYVIRRRIGCYGMCLVVIVYILVLASYSSSPNSTHNHQSSTDHVSTSSVSSTDSSSDSSFSTGAGSSLPSLPSGRRFLRKLFSQVTHNNEIAPQDPFSTYASWSEQEYVRIRSQYLATPWLLPPRIGGKNLTEFDKRQIFPYRAYTNDLDGLLREQAPNRQITIIPFNRFWTPITQNAIYSLVKYGQTSNYIVLVWDKSSLLVCQQLHLPCYDASDYLNHYYKFNTTSMETGESKFNQKETYLPIVWFRLRVFRDILSKNYSLHVSDADIAYTPKNVWKSFENYALETGADMVFQSELKFVNAGNYYALPSKRTLDFFNAWIQYGVDGAEREEGDQEALWELYGKSWDMCNDKNGCREIKDAGLPAIRTHPSCFQKLHKKACPVLGKRVLNVCRKDVFYAHMICMTSWLRKAEFMKKLGVWLLKDECEVVDVSVDVDKTGGVLGMRELGKMGLKEINALPKSRTNLSLIKCRPKSLGELPHYDVCDNTILAFS